MTTSIPEGGKLAESDQLNHERIVRAGLFLFDAAEMYAESVRHNARNFETTAQLVLAAGAWYEESGTPSDVSVPEIIEAALKQNEHPFIDHKAIQQDFSREAIRNTSKKAFSRIVTSNYENVSSGEKLNILDLLEGLSAGKYIFEVSDK